MYSSALYTTNIMKKSRVIDSYARIGVLGSQVVYDSSKIVDWTYHNTISVSDTLEIGTTVANTFEITLMNVTGSFEGFVVSPMIGVDTGGGVFEYNKLGDFYVDRVETKNISPTQKNITLYCYDAMIKLDKPFNWTAGNSDNLSAIMSKIYNQVPEITNSATVYPTTVFIPKLVGYTCRQMFGFVCSIMGGNGYVSRDRSLEVKKLSDIGSISPVLTITGDNYFELTRGNDVYTIGKITGYNSAGKSFTTGTVSASTMELRFDNPFLDQSHIDALGTALIGKSFIPFTMDWQGHTGLDAGDVITIMEENVGAFNTIVTDLITTYPQFGQTIENVNEGKQTNSAIDVNDIDIQDLSSVSKNLGTITSGSLTGVDIINPNLIYNSPTFTNLTLQNGATVNNSRTPKFTKLNGIVYLEGEISAGLANGTIVATLPVGYRPAAYSLNILGGHASSATTASCLWSINLAGQITLIVSNGTHGVCLNNIQFVAEQ